ncbi:4-formylbenzenesulfonate dehydrogenase TsaC1/TsaC2 [Ensifer adhaerens]|uniref:SDR family oxidoreductase n=1 Tax=Ensifer adhaerens TaxID=106592 RepID=UPI001567C6F7|nr:SDR family NAD(P)-dependent oxidoreductase [Ensifer adhaerens]NRP21865.1 4-formylbenzenesulfonate dehydrogenase TsaC1/TsaC2 [Ensifer adhaerens]
MARSPVALVTGAGSGIGKAVARRLAREKVAVGALGRGLTDLRRTVDTINAEGGRAMVLEADIADEKQMRSAIELLVDQEGHLDFVVANAGINGVWAPIDDIKPDEWDETIAVNLRGTYLTLHLTIPYLKANGSGSIVVISSINGTRTFTTPGATAYVASKAAQVAMVQQLALELGRHHIRINAVCPGAITTKIGDNTTLRGEEETAIPVEWPEGDVPITGGKPGLPSDIADAVWFLCSSQSRHVTGSPLWVDGGQGLLR